MKQEGTLANSCFKVSSTLMSKPYKDTIQRDNYKLTAFMNRDANILMKISANWNKSIFKKFIITNEVHPSSKSLIQLWNSTLEFINDVIHYTNRLKKKNYIIIISIDAKKKNHLTKLIPHKNSQQTRCKRNFLNLRKGLYKKPTVDIILNDERLNVFP